MARLGDFFPDTWKESLANENLKPGAVIRIKVPDTTPPKIKYLLVVKIEGTNVSLASVFINTDVNPNILNTVELQSMQHFVQKKNNDFLEHDCYADCSKLVERNYEIIFDAIKKEPSCHLGQLHDPDYKTIVEYIRTVRTVSKGLKKKYGLQPPEGYGDK